MFAAQPLMVVAPPIAVQGAYDGLVSDPDGGVRVATDSGNDVVSSSAVTRVAPGGTRGQRTTVLSPRPVLRFNVSTTLTTTGAITVYRTHGGGRTVIDAVTLGPSGSPSRPQASSTLGRLATDPEVYSGGGAVAVVYTARTPGGGKPELTVAVRPRGAKQFRRPQPVGVTINSARVTVAFGPDGTGAIVASPELVDDAPVFLRRIATNGSIGPPIVLDEHAQEGFSTAVVASDGTIAVAMVEAPVPGDLDDQQLLATSLPPSSSTPTPLQTLATVGDGIVAYDNLSLSMGADDRVVLACASDGPDRVMVFRGRAGSLSQQASFPAQDPESTTAVLRRDGGATVVWQQNNAHYATHISATQAGGRGAFSAPRAIVRTLFPSKDENLVGQVEPQGLVATRGSEAVMAYTDENLNTRNLKLVRIRPQRPGE